MTFEEKNLKIRKELKERFAEYILNELFILNSLITHSKNKTHIDIKIYITKNNLDASMDLVVNL